MADRQRDVIARFRKVTKHQTKTQRNLPSSVDDRNIVYELFLGQIDSSGIRFYVTSSLRKYDAGIMELGLEYTNKMAIPPGQAKFLLTGYCIKECTEVVSLHLVN